MLLSHRHAPTPLAHSRTRRAAGVAAIVTASTVAGAASSACAGRHAFSDATPALSAAAVALHTERLAAGTSRWRVVELRDGVARLVGVLTLERRFVSDAGRPAILTVRTLPARGGVVVDSTLVLRGTLAPVWQVERSPGQALRFDFSRTGVVATVAVAGAAPRVVAHPTAGPVFGPSDFDAVIESLPLAAGYATTFPVYAFALGGAAVDSVRVVGAERLTLDDGAARDTWRVALADPDFTATLWVDRRTYAVLRQHTTPRGATSELRSDRVSGAPAARYLSRAPQPRRAAT